MWDICFVQGVGSPESARERKGVQSFAGKSFSKNIPAVDRQRLKVRVLMMSGSQENQPVRNTINQYIMNTEE